MKFSYYDETDSLYIELSDKPGADAKEVADGVVLDLDAHGHLVGIGIDRASHLTDLARFKAQWSPAPAPAQ